ncbi:MAG: nitroreductase family protein [Spirochaetia bacterium]|nr:nitroreductase family protein [Spirochaetia bacterium]MCF7942474.1 nitroreductase family protein [Spirochaetia bacterium]
MMFQELVKGTRSFRKFDQSARMTEQQLSSLAALAGLAPSAANLQPLVYRLITDEKTCEQVFSTLSWASALTDWDGPKEGERPAAYVVIAQDMNISKRVWLDPGIAAVTIMYGAVEMGYGGCILASIDRDRIVEILDLPSRYAIQLVLALGVPTEQVVLDTLKHPDDSIAYHRTPDGVHHVPKRALKDIVI